MYFWTSSEPETRINRQSVWWATARASSVLPVPGGPTQQQGKQSVCCTVKKDALWLCNAERLEQLRVLDWQLDDLKAKTHDNVNTNNAHLLDFLDLVVEPADHVVRAVGYLLDHHQRY